MSSFHSQWSQVAIVLSGLVGLWGLAMARRDSVPRVFYWAVGLAITAMLSQVLAGVVLMRSQAMDPGNQHVFYGVVIAATFAFAYIYRAQFRRMPGLYYGVLLLFVMGLGLRGIQTIGVDF
ncbi:MAG TPA: hypothetical protein VMM14_01855 [Acidimicrobiia bacterium]|nr:hypothetical protein [Acidimicrobiia bacterium]